MQDDNTISVNIRIDRRWLRRLVVVAATVALVIPATAWAGHQFSDVTASNTFHADIDWMKDTGVTKGCNPPDNTRYCPDDFVTREQMAAFMHRLETEGVFLPADGKAVDAHTLDGLDSTAYRTRFAAISHNAGVLSVLDDYGLTSAVKNGTGDYTLTWDASVENCAWTVSTGGRHGLIQTLMRRVGLNGGGGTPDNVINVHVEDENGTPSDTSFSVAIHC